MGINDHRSLVSIIIPTINQTSLVKKCLDALIASNPSRFFLYEVIIVDDGSPKSVQDGLREILRPYPVHVICNNKNSGFASTVNRGVALSSGDYVCLVNNDIIFTQKNWLDLLLGEMIRSGAGVAGGRLLYPDGRLQHGGVIYLPAQKRFDHEFRYKPGNYPLALKTREVLGVTGALFLVNRRLWELLEGMDESYFLSWEDVDFTLRAWEIGWKVLYVGEVAAVHPEGSTRENKNQGQRPEWKKKEIETKARFHRKWGSKLALLKMNGRVESISRDQALQWRRHTRVRIKI